jgi:hypothetical protein
VLLSSIDRIELHAYRPEPICVAGGCSAERLQRVELPFNSGDLDEKPLCLLGRLRSQADGSGISVVDVWREVARMHSRKHSQAAALIEHA